MPSRIALIELFQDTLRCVKDEPILRDMTYRAMAGTVLYFGGYAAIMPQVKKEQPVIRVVEDTTFHCAGMFCKGKDRVAVLNFANAYTPGGSVADGVMAQEECLCRSSNLYNCITLPYLIQNYYKHNAKNTGDMGTDAVIYTPGVTVFKSDDPVPERLESCFWTDVITCAAPYYNTEKKKPVTLDKLETVFRSRIRNILEVAAANQVDILILGAFGCGAFHNPPELVAGVFHELLVKKGYGRFFQQVIFAIKKGDGSNNNLQIFREILAGDQGASGPAL